MRHNTGMNIANIVNIPHMTFKPAEAIMLAASMQEDDTQGWIYKVVHDPSGRGRSFIQVYEASGEYVGDV